MSKKDTLQTHTFAPGARVRVTGEFMCGKIGTITRPNPYFTNSWQVECDEPKPYIWQGERAFSVEDLEIIEE